MTRVARTVAASALAVAGLAGVACGNLEAAREEFLKDAPVEREQRFGYVVVFDPSLSFDAYIEQSIVEAERLFARIAYEQPDAAVTLLMIETHAEHVYSGPAPGLQFAQDDLVRAVEQWRGHWSNFSEAFVRASFFLRRARDRHPDADFEGRIIVFGDMKQSLPDYYPGDPPVVPVPPDFPWDVVREFETTVAFVSYEQWLLWAEAAHEADVVGHIHGFLPEDLRGQSVADLVLPDMREGGPR